MRNYGIALFFQKIELHGGGHLEFKKNKAQGGFLGNLRHLSGGYPGIIAEKQLSAILFQVQS